jgi:hypothetical protein
MIPAAVPPTSGQVPAPPSGVRAPTLPAAVPGGSAPVEAWLLGRGPAPSVDALRAVGLAAYAYTALPATNPQRLLLRPDFLGSLARHQRIRATLLPLLRAWEQAGIRTLLFKGFHLSEFVYPVAGARFYGDVDVLVAPDAAPEALRIAEQAGWGVDYASAEVGQAQYHTAMVLCSPGGDVSLDVHRYAAQSVLPWSRGKRRVTDAVWARARPRAWEGMQVWEMDPVDALLVGLVLARAWTGDAWGVKPHDAVDWRLLRDRCGVGEAELQARARELGCVRTLRLFRERCDPGAGRLQLGPPAPAWLRRARTRAAVESFQLGAGLVRARMIPVVASEMAGALRYVLRARRAVRATPDLRALLASFTPPEEAARGSRARRFHTARGVRWAARLLRGDDGGVARTLALYAALREQGWAVSFVSGVRREGDHVAAHAWVELDGRVLPELGEPNNPDLYRESFRYP